MATSPPTVLLLGTCDTKLEELLFLRDQILQASSQIRVIMIDSGRHEVKNDAINISRAQLISRYGSGALLTTSDDLPRGELMEFMSECAAKAIKELFSRREIHGMVSAGGSGATSLASAAMREALPVGFPKLIVSTVASGDTGPYVGETDITMMYSVVDVAGLNEVLHDILSNAGAAIAAMALTYAARQRQRLQQHDTADGVIPSKRRIGITMFGVTTPAVEAIRRHLEFSYPDSSLEIFVFHATGHGGRAMERLIREGRIDAVLDLTTTEIADHVTGGVMSAGPDRLAAAAQAGIPYIISLGATDMTNFGPIATVPEKYKHRKLYKHNSVVTLMRSSAEEGRQIGQHICEKLRLAKDVGMVQVWIPKGGASMISTPGGPFADQEADAALFGAVREGLERSGIEVVEDERDINDGGFARDIAEALARLMGLESQQP
ncbi:hypothetical protein B0T22DRAFT_451822 [Podospora appendiculata]|uniref:Uncharacterized protein n=1 Tax=Podospora appendiculata TaxID=314037 RepID=A0AAE0XJQ5_9PEZI|nr:hypothetical protein B0T22DRAFT_451822 [Podospora appendiculata]